MKKKKTFFIKFAKRILKVLKIKHVRMYGHKFSKKIYTLHQHIVLLAVRAYNKEMGYRRFCDVLPDYALLLEYLGLTRIPYWTTLHKVSHRLPGKLLESILLGFAGKGKFRAGIDSTGISLQHSTYYYNKRVEQFRKSKKKRKKRGRPRKKRRKKHQYTSVFGDLDKQLILSGKFVRGVKSDCKMMKPTINKARELFKQMTSCDADGGYDAEYNHEYVNDVMNAEDHIKLKNKDVPVHRTKGTHRKKLKRKLKKKRGRPRKNHRNKIETIISVLKKVFGEHLTATSVKGQRQQTRFRMIAYNAYRQIKPTIHQAFLRCLVVKKFISNYESILL